MNFPITVEQTNGEFVAVAFGRPSLRVARPTREQAVRDLRTLIAAEVAAGRLTEKDLPAGVLALAGTFADDPTLEDPAIHGPRGRSIPNFAAPANSNRNKRPANCGHLRRSRSDVGDPKSA